MTRPISTKVPHWLGIAFAFLFAISSCSDSAPTDSPPSGMTNIEGILWQMRTIMKPDGQQLTTGVWHPVTAAFQEGQVSGIAACNSYGGTYQTAGNSIQISREMFLTAIACRDDLMLLESTYITALMSVNTFSMEGERLVLRGAGYRIVFDPQPDTLANENAVYLSLLKEFNPGGNQFIFLDQTRFNALGNEIEQTLDAVSAQIQFGDVAPVLDDEITADFILKNGAPHLLSDILDIDIPHQFISVGQFNSILSENEQISWQEYLNLYPKSVGVIVLSRVGFNAAGDQALVYYEHNTEFDTGGFYALLTHQNQQWIVSRSFRLWGK